MRRNVAWIQLARTSEQKEETRIETIKYFIQNKKLEGIQSELMNNCASLGPQSAIMLAMNGENRTSILAAVLHSLYEINSL